MVIFLRHVNEETDKEIDWHFKNKNGINVFKDVRRIRTVISVPQIWNYEAKAAMVEVAIRAGMTNVIAVSEAEAAAMTIRYGREHYTGPLAKSQLSPSNPFTIVDMGGGTIVNALIHLSDLGHGF